MAQETYHIEIKGVNEWVQITFEPMALDEATERTAAMAEIVSLYDVLQDYTVKELVGVANEYRTAHDEEVLNHFRVVKDNLEEN